MALTALTKEQKSAIEALVREGRLEPVPVDMHRAAMFIEQAESSLSDIENVKSTPNIYHLAYTVGHATGEALLAGYGYRTTNRAGHHQVLARFLELVLADPDGNAAAKHFERMRRARNQLQYDARMPSLVDARAALDAARGLLNAATRRGLV